MQPNDLIQRCIPSKFSPINEYQVGLLIRVIGLLTYAAEKNYAVDDVAAIPVSEPDQFMALPEYALFIDTCYATGFVCNDIEPRSDLDSINANPVGQVQAWALSDIREYIHTLVRSERWAGGFSSPILEALQAGALNLVGQRLQTDTDLYSID